MEYKKKARIQTFGSNILIKKLDNRGEKAKWTSMEFLRLKEFFTIFLLHNDMEQNKN